MNYKKILIKLNLKMCYLHLSIYLICYIILNNFTKCHKYILHSVLSNIYIYTFFVNRDFVVISCPKHYKNITCRYRSIDSFFRQSIFNSFVFVWFCYFVSLGFRNQSNLLNYVNYVDCFFQTMLTNQPSS